MHLLTISHDNKIANIIPQHNLVYSVIRQSANLKHTRTFELEDTVPAFVTAPQILKYLL